MAAITSANAVQAIVKLVAAQGLPAIMGNLVMGNLVNRDYEPTLATAGDTVNIPIPPLMSRNNIAEGGSVQSQNPSLGNAQVVLNIHAESTFIIPDVTAMLVGAERGDYSLLNKYMAPAAVALAEGVETDLLGLYTNLTANADVGTSAVTMTEATVDSADTTLFNAKVPTSDPRFLVVDANSYSALRQIPRFTENAKNGDGSAIMTGQVGKIKDFTVFRSQFVAKPSATTYNLGFTRNAFALVMRRLPQPLPGTGAVAEYGELGGFGYRVVMSYQPNTLSQQFTLDMLYGVSVLRHINGVRVLS